MITARNGWAGVRAVLSLLAALGNAPAGALEFEIGDTALKFDNLLTVGAMWRTGNRDPSLIGKSNLNPGLCIRRTNPTLGPRGSNSFEGDTCTATNTAFNQRFVDAPGAYSVNGDNGNLNFDRGDIVYATSKLTTEFRAEVFDFNLFASGIYFFDARYTDFVERHPDTTLQAAQSDYPAAAVEAVGTDFDVLEYNIARNVAVGEREIRIKLGDQILNWGESAFLLFNSLNSINPPDATRLRVPGFDLKELLLPVGMIVANTSLFENASVEAFYQYKWRPVIIDPVGSFFSTIDAVGAGGKYFMLGFGKVPEDPNGLYRPIDNPHAPPADPGDPQYLAGVAAIRTLYLDTEETARRRPSDGGQYGAALRLFLPDFNNGTELGLYFANYHSRIPAVSGYAAQHGCLQDAATFVEACGFQGPGVDADNPATPENEEPLPVDTVRPFLEYPENVRMYGLSFNTTIGDFALSGEYVFRDNQPIQVYLPDLASAVLSPALPPSDINLGAVTIPGRRSAIPDFVSLYRGKEPGSIGAGEYVRGYERMKTGQLGLSVLKIVGGQNPIGASQMILLLEMGMMHVLDFPDISELQFSGGQGDLPVSAAADGTVGINPRDVRTDPDNPRTTRIAQTLRLNPHALDDTRTLGSEYSAGYRLVTLTRYQDAVFGTNLEALVSFNHDVYGTSPGIGGNFVHGRKQAQLGLRFDYLSSWIGEIRHTWFFGGGQRDPLRDRENLAVFIGYLF